MDPFKFERMGCSVRSLLGGQGSFVFLDLRQLNMYWECLAQQKMLIIWGKENVQYGKGRQGVKP